MKPLRRIELMAEHGDMCLWDRSEGIGVHGNDLGLPTELVNRLARWNERYMMPHAVISEEHLRLRVEGLQLAVELQRELGTAAEVGFR